jgi:hypothetical protein
VFGELRARQGVTYSDLLIAWRYGGDAMYRLARRNIPVTPRRHAVLLEFLELTVQWVDYACLAMTVGHHRGELSRARELQRLTALIDGDVCGFVLPQLPVAPAPTMIGLSEPGQLTDFQGPFRRATRALETSLSFGSTGRSRSVRRPCRPVSCATAISQMCCAPATSSRC